MNLIELHIIQSYPVSCLNRDDLNSPKSAIFGGVKRARISSQCLKRAQRQRFKELSPEFAKGIRTKFIADEIEKYLKEENKEVNDFLALSQCIAEIWGKQEKGKNKTLMYISRGEIKAMVDAALPVWVEENKDKSALKKSVQKALKEVSRRDSADIALFGRMVADDPSLNIEGAAMFSHAISCHRADSEIDFYTAVDDLLPDEEMGAGMMGTLEFNSACYYRYIGINLDLLKENLKGVDDVDIQKMLKSFIQAALTSVPSARKNSMNAATRPSYVLGVKREGQPLQLVNAFEKPVKAGNEGFVDGAVEQLKAELQKMKDVWGYASEVESALPDVSLDTFIATLTEAKE